MKSFYTRKGDQGDTGTLTEGRLPKSDIKIDTLGTIDEANAALGLARSLCGAEVVCEVVLQVQRELYRLLSEVAASPENAERFLSITAEKVDWLEKQVDEFTQLIELPKEFIVPGDNPAGAAFDLARTIARRAERRAVQMAQDNMLPNKEILRFLNRLSSLCFVLEVYVVQKSESKPITLAKSTST